MRVPSRFRALLTVFALSAAAAACSDAASPTAAEDVAPRRGRMLRPDQASMVKPGDFIVIRPEEYSKYGIPTFAAPSGGALRAYENCIDRPYQEIPTYQEYPYDGCNPDPCYDQWGYPTYNYGCNYPAPACYDQWGNPTFAPGCSYPPPACYDQWGNPTYAAGCSYPPPGPATQQNYGSSTPYDGQVNSGGILLKQVRLISWSQSIANVTSFTVDAQFKNVGAASGYGCNNTAQSFDFATAYATGNGYLEVSRVAQWQGSIKWQVDGTHTFNPISGASGGGTFYTTSSFCG